MKQIISILIIVLSITSITFSQEIINNTRNIYYDDSGNMYINKAQPVYLWIGSTPDSTSKMHRLESDTSKLYTNPLYFDEEGLNIIRSPWAVDTATHQRIYPKEDIVFEVYADGIAPRTTLRYNNKRFRIHNKNYFNKNLLISLIAIDATSGVNNTFYSIDKMPFTKYSDKIDCSEEKDYFIQYYSTDNVGNTEKVKKYHFIVDLTAPLTEVVVEGDKYNNIISQRSQIKLISSDKSSGVSKTYIRIDEGKKTLYKGILKASYLNQGEHILYYYSVDYTGNIEDEKQFSFYVDNTPPILVEEILGNSFINNGKEYSSGRSKLKLTAIDNKAGIKAVYYSLNKGEKQLYTKPFYLSTISGSLDISSFALDNVNNKSVASKKTTMQNMTYIDSLYRFQ